MYPERGQNGANFSAYHKFGRSPDSLDVSHRSSHLENNKMYKIKRRFAPTYLDLLICWLCFLGCATAPATITDKSGDSDLAGLLEPIALKKDCPF